jgi:hypothetical protein
VLGVAGIAAAGAQTLGPVDTPQTLPESCPSGTGALTGVTFDDGGAPVTDMWQLDLHAGDTLTMSWTGAADGCADPQTGQPIAPVTLAVYGGVTGDHFDMDDHQYLVGWASCGAPETGAAPCTQNDGTYSVSLVIPGEDQCYAQVDGVLGPPLSKVGPGPDESYYSASTRDDEGPDLLIRAWVDSDESAQSVLVTASRIIGSEYCQPTTTTTEAPTTTTTEAPPTTTTEAPTTTTTTAPTVSPTVESTVPTTEVSEVQPAVAVAGVTVSRQLPVTGAHTGVLVLLGTSLILLGGIALLLVRQQAHGATGA